MPIPAILAPVLATLAANGLNILAGAVTAKGKEFVEEQLGVDIEASSATPEGLLKLKQLEVDKEEMLLKWATENRKIDLDFYQSDAADRASARDMNTRVNESQHATWLTKNIAAVLALVVVVGCLLLLALNQNSDVRTAAVGLATLVLGFYFGSSSQSKTKDATIEQLSRNV